jgi:hypothetical protein
MTNLVAVLSLLVLASGGPPPEEVYVGAVAAVAMPLDEAATMAESMCTAMTLQSPPAYHVSCPDMELSKAELLGSLRQMKGGQAAAPMVDLCGNNRCPASETTAAKVKWMVRGELRRASPTSVAAAFWFTDREGHAVGPREEIKGRDLADLVQKTMEAGKRMMLRLPTLTAPAPAVQQQKPVQPPAAPAPASVTTGKVTEDLEALGCTDPMPADVRAPVTAELEGTGAGPGTDEDLALPIALDNAFCDALGKHFKSAGLDPMPYPCSAYSYWRLGHTVLRQQVDRTSSLPKVVVTARFRTNTAFLKDTQTEKKLKKGTRVALLVTEKPAGATRFLINSEGDATLEPRLREELEAHGVKVDLFPDVSPATRAALAAGTPIDPRGPACLARNQGTQLLIWVQDERGNGGNIMGTGVVSWTDRVTLTVVPTESLTLVAPARIDAAVPCNTASMAPLSCAGARNARLVGPLVTHALARLAEVP